jgi:catechol 2,3-dioxygenase-like lactoylglutathione lyase family enzyme
MAADAFDHFFVAPSDFQRTLDFYTKVLGWVVTSEWGSPGDGRGATIQSGDMKAAIAEAHRHDTHDESKSAINGTRPTIYIAVDHLEERFRTLPDKRCVVIAPERTHWGILWFVVRDPDGNLIAYTQRCATSPCLDGD